MKRTLILLMALVMAVMTTYLFYNYTKGLKSKAQGVTGEMVKVVTAKENIPQGTEIIKDMLELAEVPKSTIQPDAAKSLNDVAGKVAIVDIKQNEMILSHHVKEVDHVRYLAYKIRPGYRAVTITARITGETVANLIEPGDKVDVIFSNEGNSSFLLVNVPVLAVDQRMELSSDKDPYKPYTMTTLEVTAEDALKIISSEQMIAKNHQGALTLILRSSAQPPKGE